LSFAALATIERYYGHARLLFANPSWNDRLRWL